ncbi:type III-B CRISPR module RAMP protein Cmr4 [Anaerocellum diazotrophicum]|uniref:Type III-B CRISPR module RAMP protein Cmr4 n=1 Tax=Caldicellulosiruptor diazotrophicus TaxID=2806205 RepID=A0ABM7NQA7_9FIRM|nr:type III-B CRISPR module RAMP protein Cmr4 [Caldicellulosiruptor diazotrophicus]BCS82311.1 type III-B CRISPR module RAMP protein Cmr4 [Caldicellulosiruptor diazotrophicus]
MFKDVILTTYYCETPLHMGSGQSISYVDLPIQREKHTDFPVIWSSSIKGVARDRALRSGWSRTKLLYIFGSEADESPDNLVSSCISFTDAKILFYPVRSAKGIFAWITCPFVIKRFIQEIEGAGILCNNHDMLNAIINWTNYIETPISQNKVVLLDSSAYIKNSSEKVILEEFEFSSEVKSDTVIINFFKDILPTNILTEELEKRLAIVSDDIFSVFVKYAVEIRTRIRIDQTTGVVDDKALFTEELLPSESIFYGFVFTTDPFFGIDNDLYNKLKSSSVDWEKLGDLVSTEKLNILKEAAGEKSENEANKREDRYLSSKDVIKQLEKLLNTGLLQLGADSTLGRGFVKVKATSILFSNFENMQEVES